MAGSSTSSLSPFTTFSTAPATRAAARHYRKNHSVTTSPQQHQKPLLQLPQVHTPSCFDHHGDCKDKKRASNTRWSSMRLTHLTHLTTPALIASFSPPGLYQSTWVCLGQQRIYFPHCVQWTALIRATKATTQGNTKQSRHHNPRSFSLITTHQQPPRVFSIPIIRVVTNLGPLLKSSRCWFENMPSNPLHAHNNQIWLCSSNPLLQKAHIPPHQVT